MLVSSIGRGGHDSNLIIAGGVNIVQFFAVTPAILFIDKWGMSPGKVIIQTAWISDTLRCYAGRKPLLRGGSALMAASHLLAAMLIYEFEGRWADSAIAGWVAVG